MTGISAEIKLTVALGSPVFVSLYTAVDYAFRYKTQFRNREGENVGFTPAQCVPHSNAVPYCYDAPEIELSRDRVDCGLYIYHQFKSSLGDQIQQSLFDYLKANFAYSEFRDAANNVVAYDGFELLYSELLMMLGDDSYTAAFASRFDLAGASKVSFQGSLFEPGGIDLSGAAGYEMYKLYQATQYYQLILDRLYRLAPYITTSSGAFEAFITPETFTTYFKKLARSSAQKSRAFSQIAKRYQGFNRPDLARRIVERAYTAAYLESILIGRLTTRYVAQASSADRNDVEETLRVAALTYRAALLDMRDVYQKITDGVTYFGFAPDYIPFPALEPGDTNAFEKLLQLTRQRVQTAAAKEQSALASNKSYETDAASFQSELVKLRINYDNQLSEICGTFTGTDGAVYPAVTRYAYLNSTASTLRNPCGRMGTGQLVQAMGEVSKTATDLKLVAQQYENIVGPEGEIANEIKQVEALCKDPCASMQEGSEKTQCYDGCNSGDNDCGIIVDTASYQYRVDQSIISLQDDIAKSQAKKSSILGHLQAAWDVAQLVKCNSAQDCSTGAAVATTFQDVVNIGKSDMSNSESEIRAKEKEIAQAKAAAGQWTTLRNCDKVKVESEGRVQEMILRLKELDLEGLNKEYAFQLALANVQSLSDQQKRVLSEMEEIQQQTINVEAARNDPNVRIYKNDAIINAERTFDSAIAAAYQATKVYEYYTSQSYAHEGDLFLVRMVAYGDYNLENYVTQLEDAFLTFQQEYGNPDERVEILSLRDDIFAIPRTDATGTAMSQSARIDEFRSRLKDVRLLNENGYLTIPFATSIKPLSPLTRNHKIRKLEIEIVGSNVGDTLGRLYLRQKGTGAVKPLDGDTLYYRFPERTAVLDPFFNGTRVFAPSIYESDRLRDRPVVNSRWDLVLNQKDESTNQDIDLNSLTDIRVYVYYTDFAGA